MATDYIKKNGQSNTYKSDAGGATLIKEPVIGIVKNNIDPTRSGKIDVYVAVMGGQDPDDSTNWIKGVRYMSPFHGITGPGTDPLNSQEKTGDGKFMGNPQSYGFWATSPDIGTEVICIFVNGRPNQGYYIGCVPKPGLLQMTPAIGSSSNVVPNATEGTSYGGADRLPTTEVNYSNPAVKRSSQIYNEPKPVHSYQASILAAQGLIRDNVRGVISSSAQRETPSRVFGMSTPGGPIFEGGFTSATIRDAVKTADAAKLKQIGRTGGHTFVMDDGTLTGQDQLIRLRSSAGHQITMSDTGQTLFIIHSNGQSWIEMGKEGTIDIYSTNSFNVRTQGDINFHADRDINLNAAKNLNMFGENINIESAKNYTQRTGTNYSQYTQGTYTVKVDGALSQSAGGQASLASAAETFINGSKVNLNSGAAGLTPAVVPPIAKTNHVDTINSPTVGWMSPSPEPLVSVTNRAPAHQPWVGSGKGVDVKITSAPPSTAQQSTPAAAAVAASTPAAPTTPVTAAQVAAAPVATAVSTGTITPPVAQAIAAQIATTAQAASPTTNAANGVLGIASGVTSKMATTAGALKPGAAEHQMALVAKGLPQAKALAGSLTGNGGVTNVGQLLTSVTAQANIVTTAIKGAATSLISAGILTGKESSILAAGLVSGAVTAGIGAVTDLVKNGVTAVAGLANSIAGGKFAAGLADGLSLGGLKTALGGLADGVKGKLSALGDSVADLTNNLRSGLQNAFAAVEGSFGTLKAGVANVLGPKAAGESPTQQPSDVAKAGNAYEIAEAEIESATDALFAAKRNYRNESTPENNAALQTAEANLSTARQKQSQASTAFLKSTVGGAVATPTIAGLPLGTAVGAVTSAVKTTLNTGLNALPGGPAILQTVINNSPVGGALAKASTGLAVANSVLAATGGIGGLSTAASAIGGNLLGGAKNVLNGALGKASGLAAGALGDLKAGGAGMLAQLESQFAGIQTGAGAIKSAAAAVGTFDKTAIIAKTGQLLGDPKIPTPTSVFREETLPSADLGQQTAEVAAAMNAVEEAGYKVNAAKINLSLTTKTSRGLPGGDARIAEAAEGLAKEEAALQVAQNAYTAAVSA